ncbi:MAG: hypothetical protein HC890_14880, partial [Chloroflexaceae bacterium]|nr:hypothetical protein [Chloroflexaceae bacterium]
MCAHREACSAGAVFGWQAQRREALAQERTIIHPASLSSPDYFDYSGTALIWDERMLHNRQVLTVSEEDIQATMVALMTHTAREAQQLQPFLSRLRLLLTGAIKQPDRYGWHHHQLQEQLAALLPADLDLDVLQQALAPDLSCLNWTADYGVDLGDLPAGVRRKLKERDAQTATRLAEVIKQWLLPVIRVLQGEVGYLSLSYGTLTVTTVDRHLVAIAQAAAKNLFLDATGDLAELAAMLGIAVETIDYIAVEEPVGAEVTLTQVTGLGRLGQQRGKEQQARAKAVIDHYRQSRSDLAVIRLKRYAQAGDRRWFVDSRGSNDLQTRKSLLIEGPPCP